MTHVLPNTTRATPTDPSERIDLIFEALEEIAPFEPACCIVGPGPYGEYEPERAWEIGVEGLQRVARRGAELGITLGLEPIHRSISADFSFLTDLPDTLRMCRDIDEPNVGIMFDIWHLWDTPDVDTHIRENIGRIVGVQVDDRREPTRSWADRVLPGDGVSDVPHFFSVLNDAGYRGWLDLEIISDDGLHGNDFPDSVWRRDPREVATIGLERMRSMWGRDGEEAVG